MLDVVFGVLLGGVDVSFLILLALVGCSVLPLEYDSVGEFGMLGVVFGVLLGRAGVLALVGCSVLLLEYDSDGGFGMLDVVFGVLLGKADVSF